GGTVWNQPSDAPTQDPARAERVASNAFVILPRPGGPPAPKLPPRPATGTGSGSGSSTPAAGGGSTGPDPSPGPAGSAPFLGPRAARPINPAAPGETLLGGLFSLPGAGSPITGLPGLWNTASTSGGGRVLGLLATTEVAPVGFVPADGGSGSGSGAVVAAGVAAGRDSGPTGSAPSGARPGRRLSGDGAGGMSGPLMALARDRVLPAPPGRMAGGVMVLQWLFFAACWGRRRIRRSGLPLVGPDRRQPASGTGPGSSSRRLPRPLMWIRVTECHRQSPLDLVTSNVALKR